MADPYRTPAVLELQPKAKPARWKHPWCLIVGHRWHILRCQPGMGPIRQHYELAGCDADCERCGAKHRDYLSPTVQRYLDQVHTWVDEMAKLHHYEWLLKIDRSIAGIAKLRAAGYTMELYEAERIADRCSLERNQMHDLLNAFKECASEAALLKHPDPKP